MCDRHDCEHDIDTGRRGFLLDALAAGGLAALLSTLPGLAGAADDEVVRIGYLPITDATPLLVAHALGYFEEEGLKIEPPTLIRGWSPLVEGFAAGKFNLVHLLKPIPVWMRYNNGFPVKIMAWAHVNGSAIVVGKHTNAKSFQDLAGMQVAVPYWYSVHNVLVQMAIREAGLKPVIKGQGEPLAKDEVNLLIMPPPDMPPALAAKKIDAFTVAEPFNAAGEVLAGAKMLRFTGDIWKNHPCCVICMNEHQVKARPAWTQKVMNALVKAEIHAQANKAAVAEMLSRDGEGYLPMPADVVKRAMTLYDTAIYAEPAAIKHADWGTGRIDFSPYPYPSATRALVEAMTRTLVGGDRTFLDKLDPAFVAGDLVDDRFVKQAMAKHGGWKLPSMRHADHEREELIRL